MRLDLECDGVDERGEVMGVVLEGLGEGLKIDLENAKNNPMLSFVEVRVRGVGDFVDAIIHDLGKKVISCIVSFSTPDWKFYHQPAGTVQ